MKTVISTRMLIYRSYSKGGEVVFADQFMPSEEVQDSDTSVDLTYTTPFDIPEYDEVVISDLS